MLGPIKTMKQFSSLYMFIAFVQILDNKAAFSEMVNMNNPDTSRSILNSSISVTKLRRLKHHPQRAQRNIYINGVFVKITYS